MTKVSKTQRARAGYLAGLLHGFIDQNNLSDEEIQCLSGAEIILVRLTESEALLDQIK